MNRMTSRTVHLANGRSFIAPEREHNPFGDPCRSKPTRMAQIATAAAERRRLDRIHREMLIGAPRPSERFYGRVPLIDRRRDQCSYMAGTRDCCGHRVVTGKSWCPEHYRVVFRGIALLEAAE